MRIKKVDFHYYKAFKSFTMNLTDFDVLVGPNNAGKSTVLGAFRILSEGIRKANSRKAERIIGPNGLAWGYSLDLDEIPVSLENVFHNYDERQPASIKFSLDDGKSLVLFFPERGVCFLIPEGAGATNSPAIFKRNFPVKIGFVPVLGPVEHRESIYQKEAARRALLTHKASRNFRNIWYHYPEGFNEFRELIRSTWPGMDIKPPEMITDGDENFLAMFCPEENVPREIYWAGFGFQVWCQMLTFLLQARDATILVIDEPDIYLHSDLQRQLVSILRDLNIQIVIATHSIEIISEVESRSLLTIHKKRKNATRISNPKDLQAIYELLGSNVNPILTQLSKTRRALFLEGKDFQLLSLFARKLKYNSVANRSDFAVVPVEGFNPQKVKDFSHGIEITLGMPILKSVIFDRDYRSVEEIDDITRELKSICKIAVIHRRKEIENFLLQPIVLERAVLAALAQRESSHTWSAGSAERVLNEIADTFRTTILPQYLAQRRRFFKRKDPGIADATIDTQGIMEFEKEWSTLEGKLKLVPGKEVLSAFNGFLEKDCSLSLTSHMIINAFTKADMDSELIGLIDGLKYFSGQAVAS